MKDCVHFWVIEDGIGATLPGHCRMCGVERTFNNRQVEMDAKGYAAIAGMEKEYAMENTKVVYPVVPRAFR